MNISSSSPSFVQLRNGEIGRPVAILGQACGGADLFQVVSKNQVDTNLHNYDEFMLDILFTFPIYVFFFFFCNRRWHECLCARETEATHCNH